MKIQTAWDNFWFKSIDSRQYAALRIAFGALSLIYFLGLLPYLATQFSGSGWLGNIRQIAIQNGGSWSLFFIDAKNNAITLAYLILITGIISSFLLMVGWKSQVAAGITWLVWVSLWNRNPLLMDGDDAVLKMMSFYLLLSPCGRSWSIDARLNPKARQVSVWPLRLIQFQVALIYFVSGWVKFYSPEWQDGTVLQYVLIHPHYSRWDGWVIIDGKFMATILACLAWIIRWWELLFPALLAFDTTRRFTIFVGILFHLGLLLTMNLRWFPIIMLSLYPALISNDCFALFEEKIIKYKVLLGWRNSRLN